jgi:hypothetical protein
MDRYPEPIPRLGEADTLDGWWTKLRDKVIKPVGRVVAAYYTGGASEIAFKAAEAQKAQQQAKKAQAAAAAAYKGGTLPYGDVSAMPPAGLPYASEPGAPYPAPGMQYPTVQRPAAGAALPPWVVPAGIGAGVLVLAVALSRR